jgi:hypothetical protein
MDAEERAPEGPVILKLPLPVSHPEPDLACPHCVQLAIYAAELRGELRALKEALGGQEA